MSSSSSSSIEKDFHKRTSSTGGRTSPRPPGTGKSSPIPASSGRSSLGQAPNSLSKAGFLKRKGTWRGSWHEYYYVVDNGVLAEYSRPNSSRPRKFYSLSQFSVKLASKLTGTENTFGIFSLAVSRDPIYFLCPDYTSLVSWVTALSRYAGQLAEVDWDDQNNLLLEALNDGVVISGSDGTIIGINKAFCQLFKYSRSDLMGQNVTVLMEDQFAANHNDYLARYIERGFGDFIGKARQYKVKNAKGEFVPAEISLGELSKGAQRTFIARFRLVNPHPAPSHSPSLLAARLQSSDSESGTEDERDLINDSLYATANLLVSTSMKTAEATLTDAVFSELKTLHAQLEAEKSKNHKQAKTIKKLKALHQTSHALKHSASNSDTLVSSSDIVTSSSSSNKSMLVIDSASPVIGQRLASTGGSGAGVYTANVDGWQCVVKELIIKDLPPQQLKLFEFEMQTLESLPVHRNLARYLFHVKTSTKYQLFMTRYDSTLGHHIRTHKDEQKIFAKHEILKFMLDICRGVEILHRHEIIHRDIKSDNIFLEFGRSGDVARLVIGDFDAAKRISLHGQPQTVIGTPGFMAPEILIDTRYGYPADIWSIGMVLYELLVLERPFEKNPMQAMDLLIKRTRPPLPPISPTHETLVPLYEKCVQFEPADRPSIAELSRLLVDQFVLCD